jgi:hypothetical protein
MLGPFSERPFEDAYHAGIRWAFPFAAVPKVLRQSAGTTVTLEAPALTVQTAVGANKVWEGSISRAVSDEPLEFKHPDGTALHPFWDSYIRFGCFVGPYGGTFSANPTATMFSGIEFGTYGAGPPFASPGPGTGGFVQLRHNRLDDVIEMASCPGDGVTPITVTPLVAAPALVNHGVYMELISVGPAGPIIALINRREVGRLTGAAVPPLQNNDGQQCGLFVTSGTNAAGQHLVFFSSARVTVLKWEP